MLNVFLFNRKSRILRVGKKAEATTSTRRVSFLAELLKEQTPLVALDSARSAVQSSYCSQVGKRHERARRL